MKTLIQYILRPMLVIIFLMGVASALRPDVMSFIPWAWKGGFVIAMIPSGIVLFLDIVLLMLQSNLKSKTAHN